MMTRKWVIVFVDENGMEAECRIRCQERRVWCCGREAMAHQLRDCDGWHVEHSMDMAIVMVSS